MGGVDANDQLLKYSHFSKRTIKWWKKVFFRLLNVCMVNAYELYKEHRKKQGLPIKFTHTNFCLNVIRQILNETVSHDQVRYNLNNVSVEDYELLTGKHFISKIKVPDCYKKKTVQRSCKVCTSAEREFFDAAVSQKERKPVVKPLMNVGSVTNPYVWRLVLNSFTHRKIM